MCKLQTYPIPEREVVAAANNVFTEAGKYEVTNTLHDATKLGIPRRLTGV